MRRIFETRSEEIVEECSKLCNEKQCGFYSLKKTIKTTKSRKIRWTRHVACIKDSTNGNIICVDENVGNTSHLKDESTYRNYMMITVISNNVVAGFGLDSSSSGASGGHF